ncbi:MAG: hypothetical protein JJ992_29815 [Planctomycetes bacterium]|nr:hypothetical protein [Planctomycetota bacterium]
MRSALSTLVILELLGIIAGVTAAVAEIETIVFFGPACSLLALIIATLSYRRNVRLAFLFGLSVPTIAVVCFVAIFGLEWSPREAYFPIASISFLYAVVAVPLGVFALLELRQADLSKRQVGFQYGIAQLLGLTFIAAILFASFRSGQPFGAAVGVIVSYGIVAAYVLHQFYVRREEIAAAEIRFRPSVGTDASKPDL